jgi:GNAT superfamily N-acetyltransferase
MVDIRHATIADLPGTYRVCLLTGDEGADATALFGNPDLLGHVYVGPYVVGEPAHAFVATDDDGVAGYCLAALDTNAFNDWAEREWWPPLRGWFPERPGDPSEDAGVIRLIHRPPVAPPEIVADYPSHLHVDLLERVRGTGTGRRLMERQLASLRDAGSPACHLGAGAGNANAIAFYEHLGWSVLRREPGVVFMGLRLA